MGAISFTINKRLRGKLGRTGVIKTPHGDIQTPAFVVVGTKATIKALSPEQVLSTGAQVALANTYHLYLQPGEDVVAQAGGLHSFMNWSKPIMTDSGGFQVFSLGAAYGTNVTKLADVAGENINTEKIGESLATIDEEGVTFKDTISGGLHRFTPERSMEIQHKLGADMFFAFDECTSPQAPEAYQISAMDRTHRWAKRCIDYHTAQENSKQQALFGVVQGGRHEKLRKESAKILSGMSFEGFGIGGSFTREDIGTAVSWVNEILPEEKPRHLLGIGEPLDLFQGVENGCDTFDCVAPTRIARNGSLYTREGKINILNARFKTDFTPVDSKCRCYTCINYTRAYLAHLFRAKEMFGATLASIHNLAFIVGLVDEIRVSIEEDRFTELKNAFVDNYRK